MDKLSYKQMLTDEATKVSELENEINRLQILVAKYSDQQRQINKSAPSLINSCHSWSENNEVIKKYFPDYYIEK